MCRVCVLCVEGVGRGREGMRGACLLFACISRCSIFLSGWLAGWLAGCLVVCLSVCLPDCLSVRLSVHLSVCLLPSSPAPSSLNPAPSRSPLLITGVSASGWWGRLNPLTSRPVSFIALSAGAGLCCDCVCGVCGVCVVCVVSMWLCSAACVYGTRGLHKWVYRYTCV